MKILALETATTTGSIAIVDDNHGLIGEVSINIKIAHAERLMPAIKWLLDASHISVNEIDAFAISIGPGSFTGLRIGLSTAKGLSYAAKKPLVPVPTLDAFARTVPYCSHMICPMFDARKNEVYAAFYKWGKTGCETVMDVRAVKPEDLIREIREPVIFMGDGARLYKEQIIDTLGSNAFFVPESKMLPAASAVAEVALEKIKQGIITDPVALTPLYIRKSEAEVNWKG